MVAIPTHLPPKNGKLNQKVALLLGGRHKSNRSRPGESGRSSKVHVSRRVRSRERSRAVCGSNDLECSGIGGCFGGAGGAVCLGNSGGC